MLSVTVRGVMMDLAVEFSLGSLSAREPTFNRYQTRPKEWVTVFRQLLPDTEKEGSLRRSLHLITGDILRSLGDEEGPNIGNSAQGQSYITSPWLIIIPPI